MGGGLILHVPNWKVRVDDVTGVAFFGSANLVYSVSPVYGSPGVFRFNCKSGVISAIVRPRTFSQAYPKGADYFELKRIREADNLIYFYYVPDVDGPGMERVLEGTEHLFEVLTDGREMRKARMR